MMYVPLHHVQACDSTQFKLLSLHNLFHHPAFSNCLTAQHHAAYAAAVKCWAPAVLKVRSNGSTGSKARMSSASDSERSPRGAGGVPWYSLMQHARVLAAAAQTTQVAIHNVSTIRACQYLTSLPFAAHYLCYSCLVSRHANQHDPSPYHAGVCRHDQQQVQQLLLNWFRAGLGWAWYPRSPYFSS